MLSAQHAGGNTMHIRVSLYTRDKWRRWMDRLPEKLAWAFFVATATYVMMHLWILHIRTIIYAAQLQHWRGE
jgi:hypothetical protein